MKFVGYIYINSSGDIIEVSKRPVTTQRVSKTLCLQVNAEIPDEYFVTPTFAVDVIVPAPKSTRGGVQGWLSGDAVEVEKVDEDEEGEWLEREDVPF
jgi:hypothetical protein